MWISYYSSGINAAAEFVPCALRCRFHPGCGLGQGGVMENKLYLVIPCYNEEEVLLETAGRLREKMASLISQNKIDEKSRVIFVNDGSKDGTWELIEKLHRENKLFGGINLSRNRGHQNALLAGLMTVRDHADMVISMDADLQDDINAMD